MLLHTQMSVDSLWDVPVHGEVLVCRREVRLVLRGESNIGQASPPSRTTIQYMRQPQEVVCRREVRLVWFSTAIQVEV